MSLVTENCIIQEGRKYYVCRCPSCNTMFKVRADRLKIRKSPSCGLNGGCKVINASSKRCYTIWEGIIQRCNNPNNKSYKNYGGRGITVSKEWHTFSNFFRDVGEIPSPLEIDRIDNNGNYCVDNIRLVTRATNNRNHRRNKNIVVMGETMCFSDACRRLGLNPNLVRGRYYRKNISPQEAINSYVFGKRRY